MQGRARLSNHFVLSHLFWECPHPSASTYTYSPKKSVKGLTSPPPHTHKGSCVVAMTPYIQLLHSRIQLQKMKLSKHQFQHQDNYEYTWKTFAKLHPCMWASYCTWHYIWFYQINAYFLSVGKDTRIHCCCTLSFQLRYLLKRSGSSRWTHSPKYRMVLYAWEKALILYLSMCGKGSVNSEWWNGRHCTFCKTFLHLQKILTTAFQQTSREKTWCQIMVNLRWDRVDCCGPIVCCLNRSLWFLLL
jgi:hypothetical protein